MAKMKSVLCPGCGNVFQVKDLGPRVTRKYCGPKCRRKEMRRRARENYQKKPYFQINCKACGKEFATNHPTRKYCRKECLTTAYSKKMASDFPNGHYVYGWANSNLPFYIGMGTGERAWAFHSDAGKTMECQLLRNEYTRITIFKDGLTMEGALLVESVLIEVFRKLGAPLVNKNSMLRQERPPLELPEPPAS